MISKLSDLKSIDNKKTFLYFLLDYMSENNKTDLFEITNHLSELKDSNFLILLF